MSPLLFSLPESSGSECSVISAESRSPSMGTGVPFLACTFISSYTPARESKKVTQTRSQGFKMPGLLSEKLYQRLSFFDRTISMLWRRDHPRTWIVSANGEMETGGSTCSRNSRPSKNNRSQIDSTVFRAPTVHPGCHWSLRRYSASIVASARPILAGERKAGVGLSHGCNEAQSTRSKT